MVQVDLPAAFAVGQIFAALSKGYLRKEPQLFTNRLLGPFNVYLSCCFAPVGMFLLIGWPTWEVMYVTDWLEAPFDRPLVAGFYILFGIVMVVLGNVGFILAHHWYRHGRDAWVRIGAIVGLILTILPFLLRFGIWWHVGSYQQVVVEKAGYSFWDPPFFTGWATIMTFMVISLVAMGLWLKKKTVTM